MSAVDDPQRGTMSGLLLAWTPSPENLINTVYARSTNWSSPLHGDEHWRGVADAGLTVGACTPGTDLGLVFLFGLMHDAMRWNEHDDPAHGERAAELLRELVVQRLLDLPTDREALLALACRSHPEGTTSDDPTVGTCWDADRLNLWRLGWEPVPSLMSTADAKTPERIEWARHAIGRVPSWAELLARPC